MNMTTYGTNILGYPVQIDFYPIGGEAVLTVQDTANKMTYKHVFYARGVDAGCRAAREFIEQYIIKSDWVFGRAQLP